MPETSRAFGIDQRIRVIAAKMVAGTADNRDHTEMQELICDRARGLRPVLARRTKDWHYDSQGYCDNPGRGYLFRKGARR